MPNTTKRHPAEEDFDHDIRGKDGAHYDHKKIEHGGKEYEHGGPEGFNHQDGFAHERERDGEVQGHHGGGSPNAYGNRPIKENAAKAEGGVDFTVPPVRK